MLLSDGVANPYLTHSVLIQDTRATHTPPVVFKHPYGTPARQLSFLDNDGKILTGMDRDGDEWQITVHGPGAVIVTDVTPLDGVLDDELNTIQLVGTTNATRVTGNVVSSARIQSDGVVFFENLIALDSVGSIELNGFNLGRTTFPQEGELANDGPEVYLPGGVTRLSFNDIFAPIDLAFADNPIDIVIGRPDSPLKIAPSIQIGSIFNTVFDSTVPLPENGNPPLTPTVNLLVNGQIQNLEMVSATGFPIERPGNLFAFPTVSTTGRTSIRALGINHATAVGSLRNTTISRGPQPFANGLSGLNRLNSLKVGGVTDGLGVDVSQGNIGRVALVRGLGDTTGALPGDANLGAPGPLFGNSAFGLYGGLITGKGLRKFTSGPSHYNLDTTQNPDYMQEDTTNWTKYYPRAGRSLINSAVVIDGSIGSLQVAGDAQSSEIQSGSHYPSYVDGLESQRANSQIGPVRWKGHLVDSVVAATYSPGADKTYGNINSKGRVSDRPGPGRIQGRLLHGYVYQNGSETILGNIGSGFFARRKQGYLPPPSASQRVHGVNIDL